MISRSGAARRRSLRIGLASVLVAALSGAAFVVWPKPRTIEFTAYFTAAVGLYPGDEVKIAGVPVGTVTAIAPASEHTVITMRMPADVPVPTDARALIVAPNLVSARFIEMAPIYDGGPALTQGAVIGLDRTAVPVEWDDVKDELTRLSAQLGPQEGSVRGPLTEFVNQAAETFDGQGDSFRQAVRELSQTTGRLSDSRTDLVGTLKNLHVLVDALSRSNEQVVQFTNNIASVSQVLADSSTDLDASLTTLNQALNDVRGFLDDHNQVLIAQVDKLTNFTSLLNEHGEDIEQILHVAPHGLANFYNMYNPAQGSVAGILTLPFFSNPVQFICGSLEAGATPDSLKRAEICRQRMGPVLKRITMNYPPILFRPITSITAYKGQIIYDTPATQAKAQTPVSQLQWLPTGGGEPPLMPPDASLSDMLLGPEPAAPSSSTNPSTPSTPNQPREGG